MARRVALRYAARMSEVLLFHAAKTRSARARWILEELGLPYKLRTVNLTTDDVLAEDFRKVSPQGTVPALLDDEAPVFESGAIIFYLAEKHAEKGLAPAPGSPLRAAYLSWFTYATATLEPLVMTVFEHTVKLEESRRLPAVVEQAKAKFARCAQTLSTALVDKPYILGNEFSAADVILGAVVNLAKVMKLTVDYPVLEAYVARLRQRPAFQASLKD